MPSDKRVSVSIDATADTSGSGRPPSELQVNMRLDDAIRDNARLTEELEEARRDRDEWTERAQHLQQVVDSTREQLDQHFLVHRRATPSLWFIIGGGIPDPNTGESYDSMIRVDEFARATMEELGAPEPNSVRQREILRGLLRAADEQINTAERSTMMSWPDLSATPNPNGEPPR